MSRERLKIGVVATASRLSPEVAEQVPAVARAIYGEAAPQIVFHAGSYASAGHFAGDDAARARAFLEVANDESFDVLWFARGGYGSNRIAEQVLAGLTPAARAKTYLGYSDAGALLGALYRAGFPHVAHGPVAQDVLRDGGERAIARALAWLIDRAPAALEPSLADGQKAAAFNLTVFSQMLGTPLEPDLTDHVLMLEEVSEAMYRIDRSFFHVTSNPSVRRITGIRLGRCSLITPNEPDFGMSEVEVARYWCERSGIPWLGRADIGHDVDNRIVPFGSAT